MLRWGKVLAVLAVGALCACELAEAEEVVRMHREALPLSPPDDSEFKIAEVVPTDGRHTPRTYFVFHAEAQRVYSFLCTARALSGCSVLILDSQGALMTDLLLVQPEIAAFRPDADGTYYIAVTSDPGGGTGDFSYSFRVGNLDRDGAEGAIAILLGPTPAVFGGRVFGGEDRYVYTAVLPAGIAHVVACQSLGDPDYRGYTVRVSVTAPSGEELGQARSINNWAEVPFVPPVSGTYRISIRMGESTYQLEHVRYDCRFSRVGADDVGDARADARVLPMPHAEATARLETANDIDAFTLDVAHAHFYRLRCNASGSGAPCELSMKAAVGWNPTPMKDGAGTWEWQARENDSILVQVTGGLEGEYHLVAEDVGTDAYGNEPLFARPLDPSVTLRSSLEMSWDQDYFIFPATRRELQYQFTCERTSQGPGILEVAFGATSFAERQWKQILSGAGPLTVFFTGWYEARYIRLSALGAGATPTDYSCRTRELLDESRGAYVEGPVVAPPVHLDWEFGIPGDSDSLQVDMRAGQRIRAVCLQGLDGCQIQIWDPATWPPPGPERPLPRPEVDWTAREASYTPSVDTRITVIFKGALGLYSVDLSTES